MGKDQRNNRYSPEYIKGLKLLTPREVEVHDGVAAGRTSREIGEELNISHRTVQKYRDNIRKKLELEGYRGLFNWCLKYMNGAGKKE